MAISLAIVFAQPRGYDAGRCAFASPVHGYDHRYRPSKTKARRTKPISINRDNWLRLASHHTNPYTPRNATRNPREWAALLLGFTSFSTGSFPLTFRYS